MDTTPKEGSTDSEVSQSNQPASPAAEQRQDEEHVTSDSTATVQPDTVAIPNPVVVAPPSEALAAATATTATTQNNPITLMLQWLTYAFWGWFALSILWLAAVTLSFLVVGESSTDWSTAIAYPIAASTVLLLVAAAVDFFYSRKEPAHKQGFASVIMVIHAVIFALCGIGAVIVAVFSLVNLLLASGDTKYTLVMLYTAILELCIYLVLIARTTLVAKVRRISWIASGVLALLTVVLIVAGIVGPVAHSLLTRQDREIEAALPQIPTAINSYVQDNNKLPSNLNDLTYDSSYSEPVVSSTKSTVAKGLIRYTANTKSPTNDDVYSAQDVNKDSIRTVPQGTTTYYYKLCVTWQAEKNYNDRSIPYPADDPTSGASPSYSQTYISTYYHKKGEQCYNLQVSSYTY